MHKIFVLQYVYFMPLHVSSTWYHHTYRCDDVIGCVMQFWSPDDEHMCSKHVEAWNKLIVKQKFCASNWLITEINYQLLYINSTPPVDGLQICPKHVTFDWRNKLRINSASSWFSLHGCIGMQRQKNILKVFIFFHLIFTLKNPYVYFHKCH